MFHARDFGIASAAQWYKEAADNGKSDAQYILGLFYSHGAGVPKDTAKAAEYFTKAAEQGHKDAKSQLESLSRDLKEE